MKRVELVSFTLLCSIVVTTQLLAVGGGNQEAGWKINSPTASMTYEPDAEQITCQGVSETANQSFMIYARVQGDTSIQSDTGGTSESNKIFTGHLPRPGSSWPNGQTLSITVCHEGEEVAATTCEIDEV